MTEYELTLVVDPKLSDAERGEVEAELKKNVGSLGTVEKIDDLGKKQLPYQVKKNDTANYLSVHLKSKDSKLVSELNKKLRLDKKVLRFLIVKTA